ncbi:MAG: C1 family peptidase [Syntrophobacteraceae bacterium]
MIGNRRFYSGIALLSLLFSPLPTLAQTIGLSAPNAIMERELKSLQREVTNEGRSFKVGYSSAMDRPIGELCGLREPEGWMANAPFERLTAAPLQALPTSFDWRAQDGTTPIKNQGGCGSCWAFGTAAPLESQIKLQCGTTVDLSEQYLVSCNRSGWSCSGGWWAHDYHWDEAPVNDSQSGAVLESDFSYRASNAACGGPYNHPYRLTKWSYVAGGPHPTVQAIKQAIFMYGPVAAAVYVGPKFQAYSSGIFNVNESGTVNHAIALVGWNDDLGPDNGYWILRNSWGAGWGESGYMRIRYGMSQVGYTANYVEFSCADPAPNPDPAPVTNPRPDLEGSFTKVAGLRSGHQVSGTLRVTNSGDAAATTFRVLLYRSVNGTEKTQYLGTATVRKLAAGAYKDIAVNKRSPSILFSGQYLLAVIDSESKVEESDETNNTVATLIP